jgi:hypothetical protein
MLRTSFRTSKVQKFIMKFTSPYVNKASNWLTFVKGPIKGFVYIRACEFHYELLNFTTKFGTKFATFAEKLYEINCKTHVINVVHSLKLTNLSARGWGICFVFRSQGWGIVPFFWPYPRAFARKK